MSSPLDVGGPGSGRNSADPRANGGHLTPAYSENNHLCVSPPHSLGASPASAATNAAAPIPAASAFHGGIGGANPIIPSHLSPGVASGGGGGGGGGAASPPTSAAAAAAAAMSLSAAAAAAAASIPSSSSSPASSRYYGMTHKYHPYLPAAGSPYPLASLFRPLPSQSLDLRPQV